MPFTEAQKKAIDLRGANILVSASAGSGKTSVLVERLCQLVTHDKISINHILAMTFTNDAASEMKERLRQELLKQEQYTYQEIAKLTNMSYTYVANINLGKISYCNELPYTYPIQIKHNGRRNPLNEQEALEIIQLLKENQLTQKEIGAIYGSSYQSISRINNGNLYKQDNENYPIRKGYPRKSK